jgi:hypothetical protein
MKNIRTFFFLLFVTLNQCLFAQGVAINEDGSLPAESAILDLKSDNKALLITRLSNAERDAITSPIGGMIIYNTDEAILQFFDGSVWHNLSFAPCNPDQPGTISGEAYPECNEAGLTYSIPTVSNATSYYWMVPDGSVITMGQGTTSIIVTIGTESGNIRVRSESGCGSSAFTDFLVTVEIPDQPGTITGATHPDCNANGIAYSIDPVVGATSYTWTVPSDAVIASGQGTTGITIDFGTESGHVSVTADNSCGNSSQRIFPVTISIPEAPASISGPTEPLCSEDGVIYSISSIPGALSYEWTVPGDALIVSGQGTTSVTVDFGLQSGNVSVRSSNSCGNSAYTDLAVSVGLMADPGIISGDAYIDCNATGEIYSITAVTGADNYVWSVPADAIITAGQGTNTITVDFGIENGNVSLYAENNCMTTNASDLYINTTPPQPGSITGDIEVCFDESGVVYSIASVPGATSYHWTVPLDAVITAGQGTTSIMVDFGTSEGNVSVRAENSCNQSAYRDLAVNVGPQIGCYYAGGVIFYIDGTGEHGLVCDVNNLPGTYWWGCRGYTISGADGTAIGTGAQNTIDIVSGCTDPSFAAKACSDLSLNGYDDWFLPSIDELVQIYTYRNVINTTALLHGGTVLSAGSYWSSTEYNNSTIDAFRLYYGTVITAAKSDGCYIRAVRAF